MKIYFLIILSILFTGLLVPVHTTIAQALPDKPSVVKIRADQTLVINGKPFLPNGFYLTGNDPMGALNKIADAGFNLVHAGGKKTPEVHEFMDKAASLGVYVIIENDADPLSMVNEYKDHPALLGYTLTDDANLKSKGETVTVLNEKIKKLDSNHITFIPIAQCAGDSSEGVHMKTFFNCTDIIGEELYPFGHPWWPNQNIRWNEDALVRDFQWAKPFNQPVWALPQTFAWNDYTSPPVPKEIRNQYYVSLINGVKGFIGFAFSWTVSMGVGHEALLEDEKTIGFSGNYDWQLDQSEPLWREVQKVNTEMKQLTPVILNGKRTKLETGNPGIVAASWEYEKKIYVAVANISANHRAIDLSLIVPDAVGKLQPLFTDRTKGLEMKGSQLTGIIQPTEVHVYLLDAK